MVGFAAPPIGVPANNALIPTSMLVIANIIYQVNLPNLYLSAIGLASAGTLYINLLNPWNALGTQLQLDRQ